MRRFGVHVSCRADADTLADARTLARLLDSLLVERGNGRTFTVTEEHANLRAPIEGPAERGLWLAVVTAAGSREPMQAARAVITADFVLEAYRDRLEAAQ